MDKLNYKLKIIDDFLNRDDFNRLCNLDNIGNFGKEFKVLNNKIDNDEVISSSINVELLKTIHRNYHLKALNILKELCPEKFNLYDYTNFSIVITNKNSKFPIHDDTPNKLLSGVIYLHPEKNSGTSFYNDQKGSDKTVIKWKPNRAVFFSRKEKETWHSYEGDGMNDRIALIYNLMTNRIKDVYKIENKSFFWGNMRFKLNPYLFRFFKKYI
tara:strand:- start:1421 stop:2059 length:639 start_codon:yes stop_codon:yes gene_type:complete